MQIAKIIFLYLITIFIYQTHIYIFIESILKLFQIKFMNVTDTYISCLEYMTDGFFFSKLLPNALLFGPKIYTFHSNLISSIINIPIINKLVMLKLDYCNHYHHILIVCLITPFYLSYGLTLKSLTI